MAPDIETLSFASRAEYRGWLEANGERGTGVWLIFVKGDKGFTSNDALEESICFGWIDGVMRSIDERSYKKYFSRRKDLRNWSDKNRAIFARLSAEGLMTGAGMAAYTDGPKPDLKDRDAHEAIAALRDACREDSSVSALLDSTPPSRQRRLAMFYFDAKTEATRAKRLAKIAEALRTGYKGMLY